MSDALITKLSNTPEGIHVVVHTGQKCIVQVDAIYHSYIFIIQFLSGFIGEWPGRSCGSAKKHREAFPFRHHKSLSRPVFFIHWPPLSYSLYSYPLKLTCSRCSPPKCSRVWSVTANLWLRFDVTDKHTDRQKENGVDNLCFLSILQWHLNKLLSADNIVLWA